MAKMPGRAPGGRRADAPGGVRLLASLALVALLGLLPACAAEGTGTLEATALASASAAVTPHPSTPQGRPSLPPGFPVPADAVALPLPADDPSVIARWMLNVEGSAPYESYLEALPAAGYPIVGRYPADQAALVRFEVSIGTIWQLLLEHRDGGTRVTLRTDRP